MSQWPALNLHQSHPDSHQWAYDLGISPVLAQLLLNRDISLDEARSMLDETPELSWPEPELTQDLRQCFLDLAQSKSKIAIFGDYDADGLSGTSVLSSFLTGAGFEVTAILPTRHQGYGLNPDSIQTLADSGHHLLITVDCGISNASEIEFAQSLGLKVVVTDHHGLPDVLPQAEFILHPAVLQIPELSNLSGAGMAWWLSAVLHPAFPDSPSPESLLDLAVLGTLADMTPLRGLNFAVAKRGMAAIRRTQRPGLLALMQLKKLQVSTLTEDDLTFRMIPMLNAAGRIDSPQPALDLLLCSDTLSAQDLANRLQEMNIHRQQLCQDVLAQALEILEQDPPQGVIVLADDRWLHGVLGITCSQLLDKFHMPVVLMAIEGPHAKASVRGPKGNHVLEALQACDDLLVRYGGHEMAGGLTIEVDKIPEFKQRYAHACLQQQSQLQKRLNIDLELNPGQLSLQLLDDIRSLAPFGMGNPMPLFLSLNMNLQDIKTDRKSETHFFAKTANGHRVKSWQMWNPEYQQISHYDLVYSLEKNIWRDQTQLELTVVALRPHQPEESTVKEDDDDSLASNQADTETSDDSDSATLRQACPESSRRAQCDQHILDRDQLATLGRSDRSVSKSQFDLAEEHSIDSPIVTLSSDSVSKGGAEMTELAPSKPETVPAKPINKPNPVATYTHNKLCLPGYYFDGQDYWEVPRLSYSETQWLDWRESEFNAEFQWQVGQVLYCSDRPFHTSLHRAEPGQFTTLLLNQVPSTGWDQIQESFETLCLLVPIAPSFNPSFQSLWPILAFLQEHELGLQNASDLAKRFALSQAIAEASLKSLLDLGLLAYDKERYRIQYKHQLYDLRQSPTFLQAQSESQQQEHNYTLWQSSSFQRLKQELVK